MAQTAVTTYSQRELLSRLLRLAWSHKGGCMVLIFLQGALVALNLAGLAGVGAAIDYLRLRSSEGKEAAGLLLSLGFTEGWSPMGVLTLQGGFVLLIAALRAWCGFLAATTNSKLGQGRIVVDLRSRVYAAMQRMSFRFFDSNTTGPLINRVTGDTQTVRLFVDGVVVQGVNTVLAFTVYLVCLMRIHSGLAFACLIPLPLVWATVLMVASWLRRDYRENRDLVDHLVLSFEELMKGVAVVKGFGLERWAEQRFMAANAAVRDQKKRIFLKLSLLHPGVSLLNHLSQAILLGYGGWLAIEGRLPIGTGLVVFAGVLQQLSAQVNAVTAIADNLQVTLTGAQRVFEVLDAQPEVACTADAAPLGRAKGEIVLEDVDFAFKENNTVLHGISMHVAAGERIAIVGPTGSGKSALIQLIPRFYDPDRGAVKLDGRDLRQWKLDDVRRQCGLVFQESFLFSASVAANIAFGKPDATREEIERAAKLAAAHDFIQALPHGYDTILHENGNNLSGGQRQRLALARALLLDPAILILDDPTAAVDTETESEILSGLDSAMAGRTCFIVAHRLGAVRHARRIVVLEHGRIAAYGTHEELAAQPGYYREALLAQETGGPES